MLNGSIDTVSGFQRRRLWCGLRTGRVLLNGSRLCSSPLRPQVKQTADKAAGSTGYREARPTTCAGAARVMG